LLLVSYIVIIIAPHVHVDLRLCTSVLHQLITPFLWAGHHADFSARASVPDDHDGYFFCLVYDMTDTSFAEPLPAPPPTDPPYNCAVCAHREEEEIEAHGHVVRCAGGIVGVAVHGTMFYVGDFALVHADEGPSCIAQLVGVSDITKNLFVLLSENGQLRETVGIIQGFDMRTELA
jgi:hypothetical protein